MLNYIWFFMIVIGVIYGFITGNIEKVGSGAIESATEAVKLCITMVDGLYGSCKNIRLN